MCLGRCSRNRDCSKLLRQRAKLLGNFHATSQTTSERFGFLPGCSTNAGTLCTEYAANSANTIAIPSGMTAEIGRGLPTPRAKQCGATKVASLHVQEAQPEVVTQRAPRRHLA